jgi:hypothetical protein
MPTGDPQQDEAAIMQVIAGESTAFWMKDYAAWAEHWVQSPYVRFMGWWAAGGVTVVEGWEQLSATMRAAMEAAPHSNPTATAVRRENINLRVGHDCAWVTFDQYGADTGDARMDMPGRSRETRFLEKHGGAWKLVYVCWLLEGPPPDEQER